MFRQKLNNLFDKLFSFIGKHKWMKFVLWILVYLITIIIMHFIFN